MIKKELRAVPVPKADIPRIHAMAAENDNIRGIIVTQKKKI